MRIKSLLLAVSLVFAFTFIVQGVCSAQTNKNLPNIRIIGTGGTIASSGDSTTMTVGYTNANIAIESVINSVPELKNVANVTGEQFVQIASFNMTNDIWLKLGKRVNELLASPDVDGIVITHGTDTIEETAYFLNLVVKSDKPVVIVGAMRPATAMSADGPINLYNAVVLAGSKEAKGKGVLITLNDTINGARETTKTSTFLADTFKAEELGALGYIQENKAQFYRQSVRRHTTNSEFDISKLTELPKVDIVYGYADNNRLAVDAFAQNGAKGIVSAGTGNGSFSDALLAGMIDARQANIIIVRSSRTGDGMVARNGEVEDDKYDFVVADNLNPQKARILLMLALTKTTDTKEIQRIFWEY